MEMGFSARKARAALERSGGDAGQAVEWLLSQPASPSPVRGGGGGAGAGDYSGDEMRPPSPSTVSPPTRKSLKKPKPSKPQNPVFEKTAFTPVLVPEKPGTIVLASSFTSASGGGGEAGRSSVLEH